MISKQYPNNIQVRIHPNDSSNPPPWLLAASIDITISRLLLQPAATVNIHPCGGVMNAVLEGAMTVANAKSMMLLLL